jgi:hypothetical protein
LTILIRVWPEIAIWYVIGQSQHPNTPRPRLFVGGKRVAFFSRTALIPLISFGIIVRVTFLEIFLESHNRW